jgi:hypothetical protein
MYKKKKEKNTTVFISSSGGCINTESPIGREAKRASILLENE